MKKVLSFLKIAALYFAKIVGRVIAFSVVALIGIFGIAPHMPSFLNEVEKMALGGALPFVAGSFLLFVLSEIRGRKNVGR
jgi:hypothetical protein